MADTPPRCIVSNTKPNFRTEMRTDSGYVFLADEPASLGGSGMGPTPVELMIAAIGSCKAITARMYAERKEWPLEDVTCTVTHRKVEPEGGGKPVPHIDIEMQFSGDLDDDQLGRLKEIAERCPVQRMITDECVIDVTLVKEG